VGKLSDDAFISASGYLTRSRFALPEWKHICVY
jgi:hypothetical protein